MLTTVMIVRALQHSPGLAQGSHGGARCLHNTHASVVVRDCARV